jgi:hypothetical protein
VKWRRCFFCALSGMGSSARRAGKNELICVVNCGGQMADLARRGRPPLTLADACSIAAERGGVCLSDTYVGSQALMHANLLCEQICGGAGPATSGAQL